MVVYEVGLISNGLPLFIRSYHDEIQSDSLIRSGFFQALQSFAEEAFADVTEEFKMKRYVVFLKRVYWGKNTTSILYALCSKKTRATPVQQSLAKLAKIIEGTEYSEEVVDSDHYEEKFAPNIDEIFEDLRHRPYDRAKKLFG